MRLCILRWTAVAFAVLSVVPVFAIDAVAVYCTETGPLNRFAGGKNLRPRTGVVNTAKPEHIETEIEVAANAGIGVFLIKGEKIPEGFLQAKNRGKMKVVRLADAAAQSYADLPGVDLDRNSGLTPEAYVEKLAAAKAEAEKKGLKGVFVGSWNDYGHGRFLVPDERENDYYLRAVAKVFGRRPADVYMTCSSADPRNPTTAHPELQRMRVPDVENIAYGPHLRQRMDVWLPKKKVESVEKVERVEKVGKVPCIVVFHGGAWVDGCSMAMARGMVIRGDRAGVATVTVSYRMVPDADAAKHVPAIEWPMEDAEKALRFIQAHADEWNIDATRIGLTGGSAGADLALYVGLKDNNVLGIRAVQAGVPQTTLDPEEAQRWVPGAFFPAHAFGYGYTDGAAFLKNRAKWLPWIERYSAAALVRKIDPARAPKIFLSGNPLPMPGEKPVGGEVHSGAYCQEFKKICDARGVFCVRGTDGQFIDSLANDVTDPFDFIRERLAAGEKKVVVPRGLYRVAAKGLSYLRLERAKDVTIDFSGSKLLCGTKTRVIDLKDCTNVTVRALTVDYEPMTFTQAIIEKVDADRNWDVRIVPGYPCPTQEELAKTWPVQAYARADLELKNPNRYRDNIAVMKTGTDTYRITGGVDRTGDVGDVCVWSLNETKPNRNGVVASEDCHGCRFEDLTAYATPDGCVCAEMYSHGATYRKVRLVRCPETEDFDFRAIKRVRSGNHDAFNARFGDTVTLDGCEFAYHCDDSINISGYYSVVTKCEGNRIRVIPAFGRWGLFAPGDTIQIMTFEGQVPPDAKVLKIEEAGAATEEEKKRIYATNLREPCLKAVKKALTLTLDRPVDFSFGTVVIANERMGNGFVIRNCRFGSTRARAMLIKASDGLIENNTVERSNYDAISIYPEYSWLEGGCSRNVTIRNNVLKNNGGGIWIGGSGGNGQKLPPEAHPGMVLENNTITPRKKETR